MFYVTLRYRIKTYKSMGEVELYLYDEDSTLKGYIQWSQKLQIG